MMFTKGHVGNRHPSLVGKGGNKRGTGPYTTDRTLTRDDGTCDLAGNPKAPVREYGAAIERASKSGGRTVQQVSGWDGLSGPMPKSSGVSLGSAGMSRDLPPRRGKSYVG
jgi:hypothetical protein